MDSNGRNIIGNSLAEGGTITGNLDIEANLTVSGDTDLNDFTANNGVVTGTLEVGTLVSDIITEDPLIHLAKNNIADILNTGYFSEYNDGSLKFAGLIRSKDDKKFYVLKDLTTQPSGSTDITSLTRGDLVVQDFKCRNSVCDLNTSTSALIINNISGIPQYGWSYNPLQNKLELRDSDNDLIYDINKATNETSFYYNLNVDNVQVPFSRFDIGGSFYLHNRADDNAFGSGYTGRKARGSFSSPSALLQDDTAVFFRGEANNGITYNTLGQMLIKANENQDLSNKGGRIELQTSDNGDNSPTTKITIDNEVKIENGMKVFNSSTLTNYDFNEQQLVMSRGDNNDFGLQMIGQKSRGSLTAPTPALQDDTCYTLRGEGFNGFSYNVLGQIVIKANENQSLTNRGGRIELQTANNGNNPAGTKLIIDDKVKIENDLVIGNNTLGTSYTLPSIRGSSGQVLMDVNGDGNVSWQSEQASSHTLQQAFNVSGLSPQIITIPAFIPVFGIQSHNPNTISTNFFELRDSSGTEIFEVYSDGYIYGAQGLSLGGDGANIAYNFPVSSNGISGSSLKLRGQNMVFESDFSQTNTIAVPVDSLAEHDITSTGLGSLVVPAGSIQSGSSWHLKIGGLLRNQNSSSNLIFKIYLGPNVIVNSNVLSLDAIASLTWYEIEVDFTFRGSGTSETPLANGQLNYYDSGTYRGAAFNLLAGGPGVNTQIDNTFRCTMQWTTQSFDNEIIVQQLRFNRCA